MRKKHHLIPSYNLIDTGAIIALINRNDPFHSLAKAILSKLPKVPFLTTWPCLTEAMYLLYKASGFGGQDELWDWIADGLLLLHIPAEEEWQRLRVLMGSYRDAPMDLADASLVALAEYQSLNRIFTFDSHFYAYRLSDGSALEVVV